MGDYQKRGYLREPFRVFHLRDVGLEEMAYHYHEFHKIVILLGGKAGYLIEGRSYFLRPWDVLLVARHQIHKPEIDPGAPYERVVIYLDPDFLAQGGGCGEDLSACFQEAARREFALMRPRDRDRGRLERLLSGLEEALEDREPGGALLARTWLWQLVIALTRLQARDRTSQEEGVSRSDPKVDQVLSYVNGHLEEDLTVERLAALAYTSQYHFMRLFRARTGYTVHQYVTEKRLLAAAGLLREGASAQEACARCGFQDYSAFHRAFRRQFGLTPRQMKEGG